ncbi:MAG: hypothetical protein K9N51_08385, partial [Candidatus Pacebacteria bacterium]|nr:hypothetical protein [Candidatus Paceibacterota bacterium]
MVLFVGQLPVARAQLEMHLSTDRERYLKYESVNMTLAVRNYTGNDLTFGASPGRSSNSYLTLLLESSRQLGQRSIDAGNLIKNLTLGAGETKRLTINLNELARLQTPATYSVCAELSHPMLRQAFRTNDVDFEVREGHVVWQRTLGVPDAYRRDGDVVPERIASIILLREKTSQIYCFLIEDEDKVYCVTRLGKLIFGAEPECGIDAVSNVHVLLRVK